MEIQGCRVRGDPHRRGVGAERGPLRRAVGDDRRRQGLQLKSSDKRYQCVNFTRLCQKLSLLDHDRTKEDGEVTLRAKSIHRHPLYQNGSRHNNDFVLLELQVRECPFQILRFWYMKRPNRPTHWCLLPRLLRIVAEETENTSSEIPQ